MNLRVSSCKFLSNNFWIYSVRFRLCLSFSSRLWPKKIDLKRKCWYFFVSFCLFLTTRILTAKKQQHPGENVGNRGRRGGKEILTFKWSLRFSVYSFFKMAFERREIYWNHEKTPSFHILVSENPSINSCPSEIYYTIIPLNLCLFCSPEMVVRRCSLTDNLKNWWKGEFFSLFLIKHGKSQFCYSYNYKNSGFSPLQNF